MNSVLLAAQVDKFISLCEQASTSMFIYRAELARKQAQLTEAAANLAAMDEEMQSLTAKYDKSLAWLEEDRR